MKDQMKLEMPDFPGVAGLSRAVRITVSRVINFLRIKEISVAAASR